MKIPTENTRVPTSGDSLPNRRARQAPLKNAYRQTPASATVWLHAEGAIDSGGIACRVQTQAGEITAGLHEATGGDGTTVCSGEMTSGIRRSTA
jgi:hypothetical protein